MARDRAFSLLELLIALVLLVALTTIALPPVLKTLADSEFESAVDAVRNQLLLARAHAQATGQPVEVIWSHDDAHIEARLFVIGEGESFEIEAFEPVPELEFAATVVENSTEILEPWALREMSESVRITLEMPEAAREDEDDFLFAMDDEPEDSLFDDDEGDGPSIVRIAVFLADGSVLLAEPRWMSDDEGRWAKIAVHPLLGLPVVEINARAEPDEPADEQEPEDEEEEEPLEIEADDEEAKLQPAATETTDAADDEDEEEQE